MPSAMSPTVTRSSARIAPTGPGSRWSKRRHRVEEVGRVARPGVDRPGRGRGIGIGVPDGGDGPGRRDDLDRLEASGELRGEGEHPDATGQPLANLVEVRVAAHRGIVGAKAVRRDERALDVQAERDCPIRACRGRKRRECGLDRAARARHDGRQEARHAVAREHRGAAMDGRGVRREVRVADAVHLELDEPRCGAQPRSVDRRHVRRPVAVERLDQPIGDEDRVRTPLEPGDEEPIRHPPGRDGGRGRRRGRGPPADRARRGRRRRRASPSVRRRNHGARARSWRR